MTDKAVGPLISPPYNINVSMGRVIDGKTNLVCQCFTAAAFLHLASLLAAEAAACPIITRQVSRPHAVP